VATLTKESSVSIRQQEQETRPAPRPAASSDSSGGGTRSGPIGRMQTLLEGVVAEIRKVTWPSRSETRNLTIVVIGISVLIGGLLGLFDLLLVGVIRLLTGGAAGF
jgi:preprotein translocase SecE subunit